MSNPSPDKPAGRGRDGRFAKGNPGGPGRPRGAVRAATVALDQIGAEASADLVKVAIDLARSGNMEALKLVLGRIWPVRAGRPLEIEAPPVRSVADLVPATTAIVAAVLSGEMTPREGREVSILLNMQSRMIELADIERQLNELEESRAQQTVAKKPWQARGKWAE